MATFDDRGILPSDEGADGFTLDDLVADTAGIIEQLGTPAAVVGTSLGAWITQELMLARPDLVTCSVFMARRAGRTPYSARSWRELREAGVVLPDSYRAALKLLQNLSPRTVDDPRAAEEWLALFEFSLRPSGIGAQDRLGNCRIG